MKYKSFIVKSFIISLPFLVVLFIYILYDPFKVIKKYDTYYPNIFELSDDYVSMQTFINNSSNIKYDAFIFGNSRSKFYEIKSWEKYINPNHNIYHFSVSGETLLGINRKFNYLKKNKIHISYAIIVLDTATLYKIDERNGFLFLPHPILSHQNVFNFHFDYFKTFLSKDFLWAFVKYNFFNEVDTTIFKDIPITYSAKNNEFKLMDFENTIKNNPSDFYTKEKINSFYKRDKTTKFSVSVIKKQQYILLKEIADILKQNSTKYKIVISPLYDQIRINESDLILLKNLFGTDNVYDFSGVNDITNDYKNYYEISHYRPCAANTVLKEIYK